MGIFLFRLKVPSLEPYLHPGLSHVQNIFNYDITKTYKQNALEILYMI